jgi:hypothetical protein
VGQASGISNMARYIGGSLAVAAVAAVAVLDGAASAADALATGLSRSALLLAILCAAGAVLARPIARHRMAKQHGTADRAAAASAVTHTIPRDLAAPARRGPERTADAS